MQNSIEKLKDAYVVFKGHISTAANPIKHVTAIRSAKASLFVFKEQLLSSIVESDAASPEDKNNKEKFLDVLNLMEKQIEHAQSWNQEKTP